MNFLTLSQRVGAESGTLTETALSTVVGVTGRLAKTTRWTNEAWRAVQRARQRDWLWMRGEFIGQLIASTQRYEGSTFIDFDTNATITRFGYWLCRMDSREERFTIYDPAIGLSDKGRLVFIPWDQFYRHRVNSAIEESKPQFFSIDPKGRLCVSPVPDKAYTVLGPYQKSVMDLEANADEPDMPQEFHELIIQVACAFMETSDEAGEGLFTMRKMREIRMFCELENAQTERMQFAGPLA